LSVIPHIDTADGQLALLALLDNAGIGVAVLRVTGSELQRTYINRAGAAISGHTVEEVSNISVLDLIVPSKRAATAQMLQAIAKSGDFASVVETAVLHRDGSEVPIEVSVTLQHTVNVQTYIVMMRQCGPQAMSSLSLLEADRIALIGTLAAGVAHEINNPLTSMKLNVSSLRKYAEQHIARSDMEMPLRLLSDIGSGIDRISSNVRALMGLAQPSNGSRIDLAAIMQSALRLVSPLLHDRATVQSHIELVPLINGEEARVGQAIVTMLMFSASGMPLGGQPTGIMTVKVVSDADHVVVSIIDNGSTPTEQDIARAFNPFYQSPSRGAGIGIGLSVARAVAVGLGGSVEMRAVAPTGAEIRLRLPR
jgi:PAS domain S-box-containing protein